MAFQVHTGRAATIDGAGQSVDLAAVRCDRAQVWSCAVESRGSLPAAAWGGAVREAALIARALVGSGGASHQIVEWDATVGAQIAIPAESIALAIRSRNAVAWPAGLVVQCVGTLAPGTAGRTIRPTLTTDQIPLAAAGGVVAVPVPAYARAVQIHEELGDYTAAQWRADLSRDAQGGAGSSLLRLDAASWLGAVTAGVGVPLPGQTRFLVLDVLAGNARNFAVQWELDL